jgi:hypothetical protein
MSIPLVNPVVTTITIPPLTGGVATQTLNVPNHITSMYAIGLNLSTLASTLVTLATNIQLIVSPTGGIKVKDALDPYAFQVITDALVANGQPVPPGAPETAVTTNPLGGAIAAAGALAGASGLAATLAATQAVDLLATPSVSTGLGATVGAFPDYTASLTLINSALSVINTAVGQIVLSINNSIDVTSQSLVLKGVLSAFNINLTAQAAAVAGRTPPVPPAV